MKDGILGPKRDGVERPGERQPRTSSGEADDHGDDEREREPHSPDPSRGRLMNHLDDVDALEGTVLGGAAAGDLDVAVHDGEEDQREDRPNDGADGDAPPEDRAQGDFAEPEPVDVVSKQNNERKDQDDHDRQDEDDQSATVRMTTLRKGWFRLLRATGPIGVHDRAVYQRQCVSRATSQPSARSSPPTMRAGRELLPRPLRSH